MDGGWGGVYMCLAHCGWKYGFCVCLCACMSECMCMFTGMDWKKAWFINSSVR